MILAPQSRIDDYTARGWWGTRRIHDWFTDAVAARPDEVALVDAPNRAEVTGGAPRRLTWRELDAEVARLEAVLLALGLAQDDLVCMQLANCVELPITYLACMRLGIIATPVPAQYREHELAYIIGHVRPAAILTAVRIGRHAHAAMAIALTAAEPQPPLVLALGGGVPEGALSMDALMAAPPDPDRVAAYRRTHAVDANDIFTVCWTSGTEGVPKGVPRSHNEWLAIPENIIVSAGLARGCHLLNPFPLVNMAGIGGLFLPWLLNAGKLVMHHPFDLPGFLRQVREEAIEYSIAAPAILTQMAQQPALLDGVDFSRFRAIGSGGGPLPEWTVKTLWERHRLEVINYFGSNEGASLTSSALDLPDPGLRANYFPRFGAAGLQWKLPVSARVRTRLVDPDTGQDVDVPGTRGELRVLGPAIFSGYFRAPELTARAFDDRGYYRTGDLFEIAGDANQLYRFAGRLKDIVVRGGFNISSEELESLIVGHPKVAEAAIIGYPDEALGERVCAVVALRSGATMTLAELVAYLKDGARLAAYKLPERLEIMVSLPRNPVGKVLKRELRARFCGIGENT